MAYYSYINGAIFVCDISSTDILNEIKELSDEYRNEHGSYINDKVPIVIIADKNVQKIRNDILKETKNYVDDELLFDKGNTIEILKLFYNVSSRIVIRIIN
ncbi:hypothetical protein C2G38_2171826 [Gigaspora rosea]|uniref:Uncharacterized protein n=1 Tax=Gigaspora rosea TaxID=44941 RepID=A0A397VN01_9GLOM|nr:hypothetical protein C2G38_2171826 [Gigaspora rosea]